MAAELRLREAAAVPLGLPQEGRAVSAGDPSQVLLEFGISV